MKLPDGTRALVRARPPILALSSALLIAAAGCGSNEPDRQAAAQAADALPNGPPPTHVDSILPIEEALRRFRETVGPEPATLEGGARSRDELVDRFVRALATHDTTSFADMLMSAEEFAWLYYPHTRYTSPPYRQAPELVWFQIQNGSSRGLRRLLTRLGGSALEVPGHRCAPEPLVEGPNRIWEQCILRMASPEGKPKVMGLFGSILERDGVFKFVSYTNDF
jgi:hypothetical protein